MGKEKFQTTVKEKATDPEWYEECDLTLIGRDSDVHLTVFHRNVLGLDEFLGQTSVSLQGIENFDRPFTRWYTLKGKSEKSEDKNRGELEVRISFIVRRCNDTQSLNDLSFKKKKHSIKNLAVSVGHKIQKLPSRSVSFKTFDPRKKLERLKEKRSSGSLSNEIGDDEFNEMFSHVPMKRHGALYSSTLSLPQSAMITSSIQEAESLDEIPQEEEAAEMSDSSNSVESQSSNTSKQSLQKNISFPATETKLLNHGEWTNRILSHAKDSLMARSETNLIEALKSDSPSAPTRRSKFETLRNNLRRHTLQLSESPDLSVLALANSKKKNALESLKQDLPKNNQASTPEGIPPEIIQQYEKMNHKELVYLAIKQQGDLERQRDKIADLENYLDNLLVRVMETTPRILQKPILNASCHSVKFLSKMYMKGCYSRTNVTI
ncbi:rab11 family-interacting protein 2 isoform X1 [Parasteatoda tepidariorum]|uniref:rab11 family-interacting protein 2 isoform X1 n=1 Tax=Parasteatoda tepidariorum TaxID=114398 RepID=UPI001C7222DE|nr:rab11 family-interacting protein 1 isoform X1 [Parasteatoda tepidariorum]XP_042900048.1 rab11 family-interacting protein 1 isoform X1 [Parasteatoda tepidariorum]